MGKYLEVSTVTIYAAELLYRRADNDRLLPCRSGVHILRGNKALLRLLTGVYDTIVTGAGLNMSATDTSRDRAWHWKEPCLKTKGNMILI